MKRIITIFIIMLFLLSNNSVSAFAGWKKPITNDKKLSPEVSQIVKGFGNRISELKNKGDIFKKQLENKIERVEKIIQSLEEKYTLNFSEAKTKLNEAREKLKNSLEKFEEAKKVANEITDENVNTKREEFRKLIDEAKQFLRDARRLTGEAIHKIRERLGEFWGLQEQNQERNREQNQGQIQNQEQNQEQNNQ